MSARPPRRPRYLFHWLRRTGASLASLRRGRRRLPDGRDTRAGTLSVSPSGVAASPNEESAQRDELLSRLIVHDQALHIVRHLFVVHDAVRRDGWGAVDARPANVLGRALFEAELLAAEDPSPLFASVVERIGRGHESARVREELAAFDTAGDWAAPPVAEVADSDFAEFELIERSWAGTVPAGF